MKIKQILEKYDWSPHPRRQSTIQLGYENSWPWCSVDMREFLQELITHRAGQTKTRKCGRCIYEFEVVINDGDEEYTVEWGCDSSD